MPTRTEDQKLEVMERLLGEARAEADALRAELERCRRIIESTRLIMGHELKKPTTAMSGYLDLVCEDLEKEGALTTLTYAEKARRQCDLLTDLNAFYLELLKVEPTADVVGTPAVDVEPLLREIIENLPESHDARERVTLSVAGNVGNVHVSRNALKLIVMNLIENALLYSQVKTPVRVEVEEAEDKRGMAPRRLLKIRVVDDGVGIPESYLTKIFSPFVRLREDVAEGSGLGLTLVRSLVELSGGEVFIRSGKQEGTTVHVTLPVEPAAEGPVIP